MIANLLVFFIFLSTVVIISQSLNKILKIDKLGFTTLSLTSLIITFVFILDFFEILNRNLNILIIALLPITALSLQLSKVSRLTIIDLKRISIHLGLLAISIFIISLPLIFIYPADTLITGYSVTNDSLIHAILGRGYEYTRDIGLASVYNEGYTRGIHSLISLFSNILNIESFNLLFPVTISFFALTPLVFLDLRNRFRIDRFNIFIISLLSISPFLTLNTVYTLFVPQIVSIPFVFAVIFNIPTISSKLLKIILWMIVLAGIFNIYGVFSLTLSVFIVIGLVVYRIFKNRQLIKINRPVVMKFLFAISVFLILSIPAFSINLKTIARQSTTEIGSDFLVSFGNLAQFLSPYHITGFWIRGIEYRSTLEGSYANVQYFFIVVLIVQIFFILDKKREYKNLYTLILFFIPILAAVFIVKNPYIQFKYFTYIIPIFSVFFGVGFYRYFNNSRILKIFTLVFLSLYIFVNIFLYIRSFRTLPSIDRNYLSMLSDVSNRYFTEEGVVLLTREDWFQYYVNKSNTYLPVTSYLSKKYSNEPIRYVIVDIKSEDAQLYLSRHPDLSDKLNNVPANCIVEEYERFTVYDFNCK